MFWLISVYSLKQCFFSLLLQPGHESLKVWFGVSQYSHLFIQAPDLHHIASFMIMFISSLYDPFPFISVSICSLNAFKGLTTLSSLTYGAWVSLWWRWLLDASLSHHLMPKSWSKSLVSPLRGTPRPVTPPLNPGLLVDLAAVSVCLLSCNLC